MLPVRLSTSLLVARKSRENQKKEKKKKPDRHDVGCGPGITNDAFDELMNTYGTSRPPSRGPKAHVPHPHPIYTPPF